MTHGKPCVHMHANGMPIKWEEISSGEGHLRKKEREKRKRKMKEREKKEREERKREGRGRKGEGRREKRKSAF